MEKIFNRWNLSFFLGSMVTKDGGAKEDVRKRMVPSYSYILCGRTQISPGKPNSDSLTAMSNQFSCMVVRHGRSQNRLPTSCKFSLIAVCEPDIISNKNLWHVTNQQPIGNQIKEREWRWIGHTLRKTEGAIERAALEWNPQGARRRDRPRKTWKKTVEEEAVVMGKPWKEVKRLANNRTRWGGFIVALCSSLERQEIGSSSSSCCFL
jgi:hypothetical protein